MPVVRIIVKDWGSVCDFDLERPKALALVSMHLRWVQCRTLLVHPHFPWRQTRPMEYTLQLHLFFLVL